MPRSHSGKGATMISANIEEQRQLQIHQNSPKKAGKCSHVIKDLLRPLYEVLRCLSIVLRQSKNIQRIPYELVKISGEFTHESATSRGE